MRPRSDVVLVDLGGRHLLFCEGQQKVYAFDPTTAMLWRATAADAEPQVRAVRLLRDLGLSLEEATVFAASCLQQWREAGLLEAEGCESENPTRSARPDVLSETRPDDVVSLAGYGVGMSHADDRVAAAVRSVFGHLRVGNAVADFSFATSGEAGTYRLLGPDGIERRLPTPAAVAVSLKTDILQAILRRERQAIAVHAAALATPDGAFVLAGRSGSGKSTLAALLNAAGLRLVADDVALIDAEHVRIGGLPLAFAVKPGSWPVLRDAFPTIDTLVPYERPDGRRVRYLPPKSVAEHGTVTGIASVVFPTFTAGGTTRLSELAPADVLIRLLNEARNDARRLTAPSFRNMAALLAKTKAWELAFSDANEAVRLVLASCSAACSPGRRHASAAFPANEPHSDAV